MATLLENLVSADITAEDLDTIVKAFDIIEAKLPFLIANLTKEDIKALALLHDGNRPFCEDTLVEMRQWKAAVLPAGLNPDELEKDLNLTAKFKSIVSRAEKLDLRLYCTIVRAGAEAYNMALKFRDYLQFQVSLNVKEAQPVLDKLSKQFNEQAAKATKTKTENALTKANQMQSNTDAPK